MYWLRGVNALSMYHAHQTVKASMGTISEDRMNDFDRVKTPIMNTWKMITPHTRRLNVIGHAWPRDS